MPRFILKILLFLRKFFRRLFTILSIRTMQGRTLLLLSFFVLTLLSFSVLVTHYNGRISDINENILAFRRPSTLHTAEILIGMNQASIKQNSYLLTQNETFRQERRLVWENKIYPSLDTLVHLNKRFAMKEVSVAAVKRLLENYEKMQVELENYFIENSDPTADYFQKATADGRLEIVNNHIKKYTLEKLIPIREQIIELLTALSEYQENLLQKDILKIQAEIRQFNLFIYFLIVVSVILATFLATSVVKTIRGAIKSPTAQIWRLAEGKLSHSEDQKSAAQIDNEMSGIIAAGNQLAKQLQKASQFAYQIGEGNFNYDFRPAGEEDILGNALLQMRKRLMNVAESDRQHKWASEGLAAFADILRKTDRPFQSLADEIITELVCYLSAQQGVLFTLAEEKSTIKILRQTSYYAYDRKKFLEKDIKIFENYAEGLVGQSFIEASSIYLTEIPENYLKINSGLGELPPKSVLIVPLKHNQAVEGVIEIASLKPFAPYEREFVDKLAESIGAAIAGFKNTQKNKMLLEESRKQSEKLRTHEEVMKQNVEELAATQEEMHKKSAALEEKLARAIKKEKHLQRTVEKFDKENTSFKDIFVIQQKALFITNRSGVFIFANAQFLEIFGKTPEEVLGNKARDFMRKSSEKIFTEKRKRVLKSNRLVRQEEIIAVENNKSLYVKGEFFPLSGGKKEKPYAFCGIFTYSENK